MKVLVVAILDIHQYLLYVAVRCFECSTYPETFIARVKIDPEAGGANTAGAAEVDEDDGKARHIDSVW